MHTRTKGLFAVIALFFVLGASQAVSGQCPVMPRGTICITQEAANRAAELARLVPAMEAKIVTLEEARALNEKTIAELRELNRTNTADFTARISALTADNAMLTGQLTEAKATITTFNAMMQFMLQNGRKKCGVLSLCIQ